MRNIFTAFGILFFGVFMSYVIITSKPKPEKHVEEAPPATPVEYIVTQAQTVSLPVYTQGLIKARNQFDLSTQLSGEIVYLSPKFHTGGTFAAGETLISIDATELEYKLALAKAELASAQEQLASERAKADQAKKEWRDLGQEDANELFLRKPQIESAEARLLAAQAQVKKATKDVQDADIHLPYPSVITKTHVSLGQHITPGTVIANVYEQGEYEVELSLSTSQLELLNLPWPLNTETPLPSVTLNASNQHNGHEFSGKIIASSANLNTQNQSASVLVSLTGDTSGALPGLYVTATLFGQAIPDVIQIPDSAFHDKQFLLVIDEANQIAFIPARFLTQSQKGTIFVAAQIQGAIKLITTRLPLAAPGMQVTPLEAIDE